MKLLRILTLASCLACLLANTAALAAPSNTDLAKEAQNPIANLISLPLQNNMNFDYGPYDKMQNLLNIQPVIPISLSSQWNLITRTILPVLHQPNLRRKSAYTSGIGDLNPSFFLSPAKPQAIIWGIGPTFMLPTASNKALGLGKWSAGPSLVVLAMPGHWVLGVLTYNIWSFAGQKSRASVNMFELQYFINYNFPGGWYLTSAPINTANWNADSKNTWTIPIGAGFGRTFSISKQALNISLQAFTNIKHPRLGPKWSMRLTVAFLFPE